MLKGIYHSKKEFNTNSVEVALQGLLALKDSEKEVTLFHLASVEFFIVNYLLSVKFRVPEIAKFVYTNKSKDKIKGSVRFRCLYSSDFYMNNERVVNFMLDLWYDIGEIVGNKNRFALLHYYTTSVLSENETQLDKEELEIYFKDIKIENMEVLEQYVKAIEG